MKDKQSEASLDRRRDRPTAYADEAVSYRGWVRCLAKGSAKGTFISHSDIDRRNLFDLVPAN